MSVALHLLDYPTAHARCFGLTRLRAGTDPAYIISGWFAAWKRFIQKIGEPRRGAGFDGGGGICILGNQFVLLGKDPAAGEGAVLDRERPDRDLWGGSLSCSPDEPAAGKALTARGWSRHREHRRPLR